LAAQIIVWVVEGYFAIGALVALAFVLFGITRVDEAAKGSSIAFRALVLPGCAALWPIVVYRWVRGPVRPALPREGNET
jgi:hypothetical protein